MRSVLFIQFGLRPRLGLRHRLPVTYFGLLRTWRSASRFFLKRGADQPDEYEQSATDHKPVWEIQCVL
jgi:hypothetical protein